LEEDRKMAMLKLANQVRRKKAQDNKWFLYEFIDKNPGLTVYEMSKKVGWTIGKLNYYVQKLVKDGMINNSDKVVNGRNQKRYTGKTIREFMNWDEFNKK
jgi:predicted transcriptional regulator